MAVKISPPDVKEILKTLPGNVAVLEASPPAFTVIAASKALLGQLGLKETYSIGRPIKESLTRIASLECTDEFETILESVMKTKEPSEMYIARSSTVSEGGGWRVAIRPVVNSANDIRSIIVTFNSAASSTAPKTASRENHTGLSALADAMPQMVWIMNGDGAPAYYNKRWQEYAGISGERAAEFDWASIIHPDDVELVTETWQQALRAGRPYEMEFRLLHPASGMHRWFIGQARPSHDSDGEIIRWFGTCTDIDEQKRAAQISTFLSEATKELASSLDYAQTLDTITRLSVPRIADWCSIDLYDGQGGWEQVAIAHTDPEKLKLAKRYRELNPIDINDPTGVPAVVRSGKAEYYPYIGDALLESLADSPEDLAFAKELDIRSAITVPIFIREEARGAITFVASESRRQYTIADLRMAEEMASRISLSITNATLYKDVHMELERRQQLEEELLEEKDKLEERVKARTRQLESANNDLHAEVERRHEAETELKRSNQELQDFAYVASHDLQEPLRKIQAFGDILESEYGDRLDDGAEYLKRMHAAAARMSRLIEDLLAFSRVTTRPPVPDSVDLNSIVSDVLIDLEDQVARTKGKVNVGALPMVLADPTHMRQLFQNLISNGLKFHREGIAPVISVTSRVCKGRDDSYEIIVTDNGIGFDAKYAERIFGVFQRLHGRDSYEGTGIGLAVCRKIVERYNGTITTESQKGKGATFIITIPTAAKEVKGDD